MKQRTIEMYSSFLYIIKDYLIKKLKLCEEDEKILKANTGLATGIIGTTLGVLNGAGGLLGMMGGNMGKLFNIVPITKASRKKKYPYKLKFIDGRVVPLPSQCDFGFRNGDTT